MPRVYVYMGVCVSVFVITTETFHAPYVIARLYELRTFESEAKL